MQTVMLQYEDNNTLMESILNSAILAGAKVIESTEKEITLPDDLDVLSAYQKMFGKRKDNKYTENEIFIFNSKLNAAQCFAKYL